MHHLWHAPVLDPTNPIQPGYYPDLHQYLMAVNRANFMGATMSARGRYGRRCDRRRARQGWHLVRSDRSCSLPRAAPIGVPNICRESDRRKTFIDNRFERQP